MATANFQFVSEDVIKFDADGESLLVSGILSTPREDRQGDIVEPEAMRKALGDYLLNGTCREMHQPIAAGKPISAYVDNDGKTHLTAKVVDKGTIAKIKEGVLKGFSIGAKALKRVGNRITELSLYDASFVDRPANPDCTINIVKFDKPGDRCSDPACANHVEGHTEKCDMCKAKLMKSDSDESGHLVDEDGQKHLPTGRGGHPDHRLMGAAWAALHGGYRGHKYAGPQRAEAIARLKRMYHEEGLTPPGESDTEKVMKTMLCKAMNLPETVSDEDLQKALNTRLAFPSNPADANAALLAKFDGLTQQIADLKKIADDAKAVAVTSQRDGILKKMEREGRVPMKSAGVAYKLDELQKMDIGTLEILAVNSPTIPLEAQTIFKGVGTPPDARLEKMHGKELLTALWDEQYSDAAVARMNTINN